MQTRLLGAVCFVAHEKAPPVGVNNLAGQVSQKRTVGATKGEPLSLSGTNTPLGSEVNNKS